MSKRQLIDAQEVAVSLENLRAVVRAMLKSHVTHSERRGQLELLDTMIDMSDLHLDSVSLSYENGQLTPNEVPF